LARKQEHDEMSTMNITVGGKPFFTWDGDEAAVLNILDDFPSGAQGVGLSPQAFADNLIVHLKKGSLLAEDQVGQEMQMMGVIWRILTAETGLAERPGKIGDYAANTDFDVDIEIGPQSYKLHVDARSKFNS
jgi:hypothetical protein